MSARAVAAIAGVGATEFGRKLPDTPLAMTTAAITAAARDAGLERTDIDGLIVNVGSPTGVDYDVVADRMGLPIRYVAQTWSHGRWVASCIQEAAMAVACGLADVVAVVRAASTSQRGGFGGRADVEGSREGGGPHGELPHYGLTAPASGAAMSLRLYEQTYGVDPAALGHVAVALRAGAALNPRAVFRTPVTMEDYLASPVLIDPMRRLDFSVSADGGICLLVTSAQRAADCRAPVYITGMQGIQAGREEFVFARPGLGIQQQKRLSFVPSERDVAARRQANVEASDIDAFYTYDAFSPLIWYALERHGFCRAGEAPDFCSSGQIQLGRELPVNTNGGMLSEGHLSGFNHMLEMVSQLRGACGDRQVADARVVQWGSCFGDALVVSANAN